MTTKNPNTMLRRIRFSVVTVSRGDPAITPPAVRDLIQAFQDLDNHLSWGGTPPEAWNGALSGPAAQTAETHPVMDIIRRM
ncbi:MAG TPA: hypothetical protein VIY28_18775 [Pseudonocardiaceae bacterium]